MSLFDSLFGTSVDVASEPSCLINPASGLPMATETIDVAGNVFGTDAYDYGSCCDRAWTCHDTGSIDIGCSFNPWD